MTYNEHATPNNIRERINRSEISTFLSPQKFKRHVEGTAEYIEYDRRQVMNGLPRPSRLLISYDEAQRIIDNHAGSSVQPISSSGAENREFID